jgi:hypothetical protein
LFFRETTDTKKGENDDANDDLSEFKRGIGRTRSVYDGGKNVRDRGHRAGRQFYLPEWQKDQSGFIAQRKRL